MHTHSQLNQKRCLHIDKNAINQNLIFFTGVIDDNEHSRTLYNKKK